MFDVTETFVATTFPLRVIPETVAAFMMFEPTMFPYKLLLRVVIKALEATTLPFRVTPEIVEALMVFEPVIGP